MKDENNTPYDLGILNGKVYLEGGFISTNIYVKDQKVSTLTSQELPCKKEVDAKGCMVLPGLIDPHVHFKLGVGERVSSDDFYVGSRKGALGGITTYIDFLDPVKKAEEIEAAFQKRLLLAKDSLTDYAFHTTIANPDDNAQDIIDASKKVGIKSIKLFTTYSDTDRRTKDGAIYDLLTCSRDTDMKIVIHAENDELVSSKKDILVKDHEASRPVLSETVEIMKLASMARVTKGNLYIVHVSAGSSVKQLVQLFPEELKKRQILIESCPHYFIFDSSVYEKEEGYRYTMTPPLRPDKERELLNECIDFVTTIGTDHCPCATDLKRQTYTSQIFMGVGGIQYSFLNMFTRFGEAILDKYTLEPAKAYGLYPRKGSLLPGADADILIFDPKELTTVEDTDSIYDGYKLQGAVKKVFLRGELIVEEEKIFPMTGSYIRR